MKKALLAVIATAALSTAYQAPATECIGYLIPKGANLWKEDDEGNQLPLQQAEFVVAVPKQATRWQPSHAVRLNTPNPWLLTIPDLAACSLEENVHDKKTDRILLLLLDGREKGFEKRWAVPSDLRTFFYDYPGGDQYGPSNLAAIAKAAALALDEIRFKDFKAPEIENSRVFKAPFDATWSALIETMSDQRWQVESVDKSSGLITTKPAKDRSGSTMACATKYDEGNIVFLNVFVKAITDGVRVKINATFNATRERQAISCYSNGRLEKEFFDGIAKSLAESVPAK